MKVFALLALASIGLAACGFHSETVVQKPAPQPATVVVPSSPPPPPPTTVYVPSND